MIRNLEDYILPRIILNMSSSRRIIPNDLVHPGKVDSFLIHSFITVVLCDNVVPHDKAWESMM